MKKLLKTGLLSAVSAIGLGACGGGGDGTDIFSPPIVLTSQEKISTNFAQIFNKSANDDPTDPVPDSAVPALTLTAEPIDIPS